MGIARRIPLPYLLVLLLLLLYFFSLLQRPVSAVKKSYVVYLGSHAHSWQEDSLVETEKVTDSHYQLLGSFLGSKEKAQDAIFYSYTKHINGFAANLEEDEAMEISKSSEVISVFPNKGRQLHTTRSWSFLGLEKNGRIPPGSLWTKARFGEDTIIGNLDTGVWPESESFNDDGMGPVPSRWKGICQSGSQGQVRVRCNRKLIGARYFNKGYAAAAGRPLSATFDTPRDDNGHGTHTLSTAGGGPVRGASVFGFGNGTARGGSPGARVAAYRVCWPPANGSECFDADILAGFDAAIRDGVDVLSVSLGGAPSDYFADGLAIGSFHAVRRGIAVVCSGGNSGPAEGTVSNLAPWILTAGASTMDREFASYASLVNQKLLKGQSLSPKSLPGDKIYPLISSLDAKASNATQLDAQLCFLGSLNPKKVKGKIVACLRGTNARVEKGETVRQAGGAGMILANDESNGYDIMADAHVVPATHLSYLDGLALFAYINSTKFPMARITAPKTVLDTKPAPFMAAFSSKGPNTITPEILKPDVTAPGVSVVAAFTQAIGPTDQKFDSRRVLFNSLSGTSMSCPHVSGVVGLLRTLYPHWSPAAIKSAIMTTARTQDNTAKAIFNASSAEATPFSYGAGHINPNRAADPGLVYDLTPVDYLNFLCSLGYSSDKVTLFSDTAPFACPAKGAVKASDLNYPSITVPGLTAGRRTTVTRRLKNVGRPGTYTVRVEPPAGIFVSVAPATLRFEVVGEEKSFEVTFEVKRGGVGGGYVFGRLIWSDGVHYVRSPLVVKA